jgi:hypothetical protein
VVVFYTFMERRCASCQRTARVEAIVLTVPIRNSEARRLVYRSRVDLACHAQGKTQGNSLT